MYIFFKSAQSKLEITRDPKMISPPMVGVPLFISMCHSGPSSLIGCPSNCLDLSHLIIRGEKIKHKNKAVIRDAPPLKVKYLTILKKLCSSIKVVR